MSKAVRWSAGAGAAVLMLLGLVFNQPGRELSATSFGTVPQGYRAVYELLVELGVPVTRSFTSLETLRTDRTVWWLEPFRLCEGAGATPGPENEPAPFKRWLERGGTAVVWLNSFAAGCEALAGAALPKREGEAPVTDATSAGAVDGSAPTADGTEPTPDPKASEPRAQALSSTISPRKRTLSMPPLSLFADGGDWQVLATVEARPLVLSRAVGAGRLVVVSDARIVQNAWLDQGDASTFAVDVANAYGPPVFDERQHGLRAEESSVRYLATSAAAPLFLGLLLTGLLFAWRGSAWPVRRRLPGEEQAPALEAYVDSMATLYARSRDFPRMLERYRELTVARLCRHFGLSPHTPAEQVVARLRQTRRCSAESLRLLESDWAVESETALRAASRAFDRLVEEVVG